MSATRWSGTIKVGWTILDRDLGPQSEGERTPAEMRAIYDRIEDLVTQVVHRRVTLCIDEDKRRASASTSWRPAQRATIWIDGEDKPPVDVFLTADGGEIEIDEGADNGVLSDLRAALEEDV